MTKDQIVRKLLIMLEDKGGWVYEDGNLINKANPKLVVRNGFIEVADGYFYDLAIEKAARETAEFWREYNDREYNDLINAEVTKLLDNV